MDSGGNSGDTARLKSKNGGGTSGSNTNKTNTQYNRTTNRHYQSTSDAEINSLVTVGEDQFKASNRVSDKLNPDGSPITQRE
jgi:hypothetical protein